MDRNRWRRALGLTALAVGSDAVESLNELLQLGTIIVPSEGG